MIDLFTIETQIFQYTLKQRKITASENISIRFIYFALRFETIRYRARAILELNMRARTEACRRIAHARAAPLLQQSSGALRNLRSESTKTHHSMLLMSRLQFVGLVCLIGLLQAWSRRA